jgi:hypothetical protein
MATTAMRARSRAGEIRSWVRGGLDDTDVLIILAAAMVLSATLGLWLSRDTFYSIDEIDWFSTSPHLDLRGALEPYTGHLILTTRLVYAGIFHAFGTGYLPFRLLTVCTVLLTAGLFFVFARRRIGAVAALAPTLVLLFYGSDASRVLWGVGFTELFALAAGLGALLALEREDLPGDIGACLLLCLTFATYSEGIPFVVGAAVLILIGRDRWRRAWVFLIPVLLYAAWVVWTNAADVGSATEGNIKLSNLLLLPSWGFNSLSTAAAALLGLNYEFGPNEPGWGYVVAVIALGALGWRLLRGDIPKWLWATMALLVSAWLIHAAAAVPGTGRVPDNTRYLFPATLAVLLVAVEAARGVRIGRGAMVVLYIVTAISLSANLAQLRNGSAGLRQDSPSKRTELAVLEITEGRLGPRLQIGLMGPVMRQIGQNNVTTGYLEAVREFGSPAFSLPELRAQDELIRQFADADLADSFDLRLEPTAAPATRCRRIAGKAGEGTSFELPRGGAVLRTQGQPAELRLRRFATGFTVPAGTLTPGSTMTLSVPPDAAPDPWYASASTAALEVCGPP